MDNKTFNKKYGWCIENLKNSMSYPKTNERMNGLQNPIHYSLFCAGNGIYKEGRQAATHVYYQDWKITFYPTLRNIPVFSFQFSGCYMAKFYFRGYYYVCHIFCYDNDKDCKSQWNNFIIEYEHDIHDLILFKPTKGHEVKYASSPFSIGGLITENNECYSFVLCDLRTTVDPFAPLPVKPEVEAFI